MAVRGQYIVQLRDSTSSSAVASKGRGLIDQYGGTVNFVFDAALRGFSLSATEAQAARIAGDDAVALVQRNQRAVQLDSQDTSGTSPSLWNLDRIDQRPSALDGRYNYGPTNVPIYVLDGGVRTTHVDFEGRATAGFSAFSTHVDCDGHGTRVAAIAGGRTYGAAKQSPIISVKVADCGTASTDTVLRGIEYVRQNASTPAVVNMSIGFAGVDAIVDQAVTDAISAGLTFVVAAGNGGVDSCSRSPARIATSVPAAIVVSGTDSADTRHADANHGACVSMFAPGVNIASAGKDSDTTASAPATGTSYAAPLVAGAAATMLASHPGFSPVQVKQALLGDATPNVVVNPSSPAASNRLLHIPPPTQPATSVPNATLNGMFNAYGDQGGHWTGGDEAMSVLLPDGRVAWFFGDTNLGTVNPDGSRPANSPMVHNSIVLQQGNQLTQTLVGGTAAEPKSYVGSETDGEPDDLGWWPGEGRVVGNQLQVFYTHVGSGGGGALSYVTLDRAIATFSLPNLTLQSLTSLRLNNDIGWGAAMVDGQDGYTYIYGIVSADDVNHLHVARAPSNELLGPVDAPTSAWRFWTGAPDLASQWSAEESDSVSTMTGVGSGFSVKYLNGRFVLVTLDLSQPFTNRVLAFSAATAAGPFIYPTLLYKAPDAVGNRYVYNARIHPEQNGSGGFVVSYNVNSLSPGDTYANVHFYRPKFINVQLAQPVNGSQVPDAPKNVTATSPTDGQVTLSWAAPPGSGLTYWIYERNSSAAASQFTRPQNPTSATTVNFGLLTPGVYEFRVAAQNSVGEGYPSLTATVGVVIPPPANAPANLTATANDDASVSLAWSPVTAAGWVNYHVYQKNITAGETEFTAAPNAATDGTTARVTNLTSGSTYAFYVTASNGGGEGPASNTVEATATVPPPPAPTNLVATANDDGTIGLSWNSSGPGLWYWVYSRDVTAGGSFSRSQYPVSSGTTSTAGYLTNGHTYAFYVTAIGVDIESEPSSIAQAVSYIPPPAAPTNLRAVAGNAVVSLTWNSVGPDVWYWVYTRDVTEGGSFTRSQYPVTNGTTFTAAYLSNGHTYAFYVAAIGDGGESAPSNTVQAVPRIPPPPAPGTLTATANNDGTIRLSWGSSGSGIWYWVYSRDVSGGGSFARSRYPVTSGTTFNAAYLTLNHTYEFYVTAFNDGGESARSNKDQATATIPPPPAPGNLSATPNSDGTIRLSWGSSGSGIWYWVYTRSVPGGSFARSKYPVTSGTTFTAAYLTINQTYEFYVTAFNKGGESAKSNTVQATSTIPPPGAPSNLRAYAGNRKALIVWNPSPTPNVWYWVYTRDVTANQDWMKLAFPVTQCCRTVSTALIPWHTYQWKIVAFNAGGESAPTNIASAIPWQPTYGWARYVPDRTFQWERTSPWLLMPKTSANCSGVAGEPDLCYVAMQFRSQGGRFYWHVGEDGRRYQTFTSVASTIRSRVCSGPLLGCTTPSDWGINQSIYCQHPPIYGRVVMCDPVTGLKMAMNTPPPSPSYPL